MSATPPPLTVKSMNAPQRIIVLTFPVICLLLGSDFIVAAPEEVKDSPTLRVAHDVLPMYLWGYAYCAAGLAMAWSLVSCRFLWVGLAIMVGLFVIWSIIFLVASFVDVASSSVWIWPGGLAAVGWGCIYGLASRDRTEP